MLVQERDLSRTDAIRLQTEAQYRERFVATLTHDLRSPLATAKLSADMIASFPDDLAKVRNWAGQISLSLERADRMIADLLDASRLQAGEPLPLEFAACDLLTITRDLVDELARQHGERFTIEHDGATLGMWNADALRRVLDNLLSNAVKYGDADQPITVRMRQIDDRLLLMVHNFGTIIPLEDQQKLFQPFHRTSTAQASGKPGWGIGLALVKGLVEAHHGVVKAESYPKEGTTFTVDGSHHAVSTPRGRGRAHARAIGSRTTNVAPRPAPSLVTPTLPPWSSTSRCTIESPRPSPP